MNVQITIYCVGDDASTQRAREAVSKLTGVKLAEVVCPESVRELYRVPFITDEHGGRHFGLDGIESFVSRRLASQGSQTCARL